MNNIKIIKSKERDLPEVLRFIAENFHPEISKHLPDLGSSSDIDFDSFINYFLKLNKLDIPNCIYIAYDKDKIVGAVSGKIEKHPWFYYKRGQEHFWFVKKEYRKSECGQALFDKLIKWFKENNADKIQMSHYSWNNSLSKFYNKNGLIPYETHYILKERN